MNTNATIREDQKEKLKAISLKTGVEEDELIRQGIDLLIAEKQGQDENWRQALNGIFGIWKDRDDLDSIFQSVRDEIENRHSKLFVDSK